jgi:hypothetical protein
VLLGEQAMLDRLDSWAALAQIGYVLLVSSDCSHDPFDHMHRWTQNAAGISADVDNIAAAATGLSGCGTASSNPLPRFCRLSQCFQLQLLQHYLFVLEPSTTAAAAASDRACRANVIGTLRVFNSCVSTSVAEGPASAQTIEVKVKPNDPIAYLFNGFASGYVACGCLFVCVCEECSTARCVCAWGEAHQKRMRATGGVQLPANCTPPLLRHLRTLV